MQGEVTVREARPEDNDGLIALDAACSMGEAVALRFDRSPDFFARAGAYERAIVLVAEVDGRLVGIGAAAFKVLRVGGSVGPWAYLFDLRVAPETRRRGVASAVGDGLRARLRAAGVSRAYSLVLSDNASSSAFVSGRGSEMVRTCRIAFVGLPAEESGGPPARRMEREEAAACADPAFAAFAAASGRDAGVHLFARTGADPPLLDRPVFLDPADL